MDATSQHLSMSLSPAKIQKFASFRRWNGTERKFSLRWPWKSGHRSKVIVGTDLKFSGKMQNCSKVRYSYTKFRNDRPIRSRVILGKPEGEECITPPPPVPARVNPLALYHLRDRDNGWFHKWFFMTFTNKIYNLPREITLNSRARNYRNGSIGR